MLNNIVFIEPDDPELAQSTLARAMRQIGETPLLGIIIKIAPGTDGHEQIVNWQFADTNFIKILAVLVLPEPERQG
jgi:hypothetical protein